MLRHADQPNAAPTNRNPVVIEPAPAPLHVQAATSLTRDARILAVLETVAREIEKPQSVRSLAALVHLSPSRLEHLFKEETGLTIKAFLGATRMARAKEMLQDRTLQIKQLAPAVGYKDVSHFSRGFKKRYGQSPSRSRSPSA